MSLPYLRLEVSGAVIPLKKDTSTVGRGPGVDITIEHPSVSRLHAEIVRRGPHVYVSDLGLSRNGTRVNGRPVGRRLLVNGDVLSFGIALAQVGGIEEPASVAAEGSGNPAPQVEAGRGRVGGEPPSNVSDTLEMRKVTVPDLTRREAEVLVALCRPLRQDDAFVAPASAREIASELVVTEAAVKQHLLRLYAKFRVPEGGERRTRLANEVIRAGVVRPARGVPDTADS